MTTDPVYEYKTRYVVGAPNPGILSSAFNNEWEMGGWKRVWADLTTTGTFIVYRREVSRYKSTPLTIRTAAKARRPLDGADAQALEHALTQADTECVRLRAELTAAKARIAELEKKDG